MLIRTAQNKDIDAWLRLAKKVSPLFGVEDMSADEQFVEYVHSAIKKNQAIAAVEKISSEAVGFISYSKSKNMIAWFAVDEDYRKKGAGTKLLYCALNQLDTKRDITVITFLKDQPGCEGARAIYEKFGFEQQDEKIADENGNKRCRMVLKTNAFRKAMGFLKTLLPMLNNI